MIKKSTMHTTETEQEKALNRVPRSIKLYNAQDGSGDIVMQTTNVSNHHSTNRPHHYHKRSKGEFKNKLDFVNEHKRVKEFIKNNIQCNDYCRFITLKFDDHRIKTVSFARQRSKDYCDSLPGIVTYQIRTELDYNHHPHVHILLRVKRPLATEEYEAKWPYGRIEIQKLNGNWDRLCNYLVKIPKNDNFSFDMNYAKFLVKEEKAINEQLANLNKKYKVISHASKVSKVNVNKNRQLCGKLKHKKTKVHNKLKLLNQLQLRVDDRDLYTSYGSNRTKNIQNGSVEKEKCFIDLKNVSYICSKYLITKYVDLETGQIIGRYKTIKDIYKKKV